MSKPKTSSIPATTKALQAWQSELRRLERRLEEWSNELAAREENLEQQEAAFETALEGADEETIQMYANSFPADEPQDCGFKGDDEDECDCPRCKDRRSRTEAYHNPTIILDRRPFPGDKGDELQWLEKLWTLEDGRKKKK